MADANGGTRGRGRGRATGVAFLLAAVTLCFPAAPAEAAGACWDDVRSDVDGGGPDVVLGLPSFDLPGKPDAGALVVFSDVAAQGRSDPRPAVRRTLVTAADVGLPTQAGARFGAAVVVWRVLGTTCAEVLVGAPGQDVGGHPGAGQVYRLPGSPTGLGTPVEVLDEDVLGTGAQTGAAFGAALAGEGSDWFAVGVPRRDVGAASDAGRVVRVDRQGPGPQRVTVVQQGGAGAGAAETGDRFGEVLAVDGSAFGPLLFVGVPHEDVGARVDAGALAFQPYDGALSMATQDSPGAAGVAEAGDRYGSAVATFAQPVGDHVELRVAVGVPGEDLGRLADAGAVGFASVDLFTPTPSSLGRVEGRARTLTQDTPGVAGVAERGDGYGAALATGEFGVDAGRLHLAVGAPGEDVGTAVDAGTVSLTGLRVEEGAPPSVLAGGWTQDSTGVAGRAETGDRFGAALAGISLATEVDDDDQVWPVLLATVPGEDEGATADTGMAHLGLPPRGTSVALVPPVLQAGAGRGLTGQRMLVG